MIDPFSEIGDAFDQSRGCRRAPSQCANLWCYWPNSDDKPCEECQILRVAIERYADGKAAALRAERDRETELRRAAEGLVGNLERLNDQLEAERDRLVAGLMKLIDEWRASVDKAVAEGDSEADHDFLDATNDVAAALRRIPE